MARNIQHASIESQLIKVLLSHCSWRQYCLSSPFSLESFLWKFPWRSLPYSHMMRWRRSMGNLVLNSQLFLSFGKESKTLPRATTSFDILFSPLFINRQRYQRFLNFPWKLSNSREGSHWLNLQCIETSKHLLRCRWIVNVWDRNSFYKAVVPYLDKSYH